MKLGRIVISAALALCASIALSACEVGKREAAPISSTPADGGWVPLFNGKNLDGFYTFLQRSGKNKDPNGDFQVTDGMIHFMNLAPTTETQEIGYLCTEKSYSNFHLRFEYKWGDKKFAPRANMPHDSGCLFLMTGDDKLWPSCMEFQMAEQQGGDLWILNNAYTMQTTVKSLTDRQKMFAPASGGGVPWAFSTGHVVASENPDLLTDWNKAELIIQGNNATQIVNGKTVMHVEGISLRAGGTPVTEGRIGFQCQAAEMYLRNLELKPLK